MKTIYKYPIGDVQAGVFHMPLGARVVQAGNQPYSGPDGQYDRIMLWVEVDPDRPNEQRRFQIIGTGQECPGDLFEYAGTALVHNGAFVWHVYLEQSQGV